MSIRYLFLLLHILAFAKAQNTDSLIQVYEGLPKGEERMKLAAHLGDLLPGEEGRYYFQLCIAEAHTMGLELEAAQCSLDLASYFLNASKYDSLAYICDAVIDGITQYKDSFTYARAWKLKGLAAQYQGKYNTSIELFLKVSNIYRKIDPKVYAENQMDIGLVYIRMEAYEKAKPFIQEALKKTRTVPESQSAYANSLNCYSIIMRDEGKKDSAKYYLRRSAAIHEKVGNVGGQVIAYTNLGQQYLQEPVDYDSASAYFEDAIEMARQIGDKRNLSALLISQGLVREALEEGEAAADLFYKAEVLADSINYLPAYQIAIYNRANVLNEQTSQKALAADLFQQYADLRDSLFTKEQMAAIEEVNAKYETAENARKLAASDAQLAQRNTWIVGLVAAAGLALLIATLIALQARSRQRQLRIEAQAHELKSVIDATENERRRIARDLHDGVGQELSSLLMSMEGMSENPSPELEARLRHATEEVRSISHQMMPRSLEVAGLVPALENLVKTSFAHQETVAQFDAFRIPADLNPQIDLVMYRVAQELLNNVLRHAEAKQVDVLLSHSQGQLSLMVEDDGKGVPADFNRNGLGLTNMKTRLSTVEGMLAYEVSDPQGTRAIVTIPTRIFTQ